MCVESTCGVSVRASVRVCGGGVGCQCEGEGARGVGFEGVGDGVCGTSPEDTMSRESLAVRRSPVRHIARAITITKSKTRLPTRMTFCLLVLCELDRDGVGVVVFEVVSKFSSFDAINSAFATTVVSHNSCLKASSSTTCAMGGDMSSSK